MIVDQFQLDIAPEVIEANLEAGYAETMWLEGGH